MKPKQVLGIKASQVAAAVAVVCMLNACAPLRPFGQAKTTKDSIQKPDITVANQTASTSTLPIERLPSDVFWVKPQFNQGQLPMQYVDRFSVTERGLYDVLQMLFVNTRVPVSFEGGAETMARYGVVSVNNLSGNLNDVMNKLAEMMGFFWSISDSGILRIMPDQQFVVTMPPILNEDSMAGVTNTMQYLGAKDVYLDRINRSLVFRSNRKSLDSIQNYLDRARQSRSLIVYDMNVLQVDLNDSNTMGVRWELYKSGTGLNTAADSTLAGASSTASRITQIARTSTGIETLILGENFSTNTLVDFLRTQGDVKTLSQPKIGLMNGTNGSIRVGQSTTFVSRVGSQIVNGVTQSTADTQNLRTGLEMSLTGETHDATIYTRINVSITELLALKRFTALGVDLNLPEVADRELKTQVRCRPGDTILLGGITVTRSQDDFQTGLGIRSRGEQTKQTELVITIRPRLLLFDVVPKTVTNSTPEEESAKVSAPHQLASGPMGETSKPLETIKVDEQGLGRSVGKSMGLKAKTKKTMGLEPSPHTSPSAPDSPLKPKPSSANPELRKLSPKATEPTSSSEAQELAMGNVGLRLKKTNTMSTLNGEQYTRFAGFLSMPNTELVSLSVRRKP